MWKKQNKTNKKPDSWNQSTVRAAAPLRPRRINNGGMSRGSHLGIHSLRRFGCLLQVSREASGFAAHLTLWPFFSVLHKSSYGAKQPLIKWKKVHRSQVFTLLYPIADEGEARWVKKKSRWCFSSLKTTLSFCSGWQFKGVLGSSDSADKTAEQKSTKWNTLSSHSSSTLMILLLTYFTWRIFHQLLFLTPPLCRFGCFICF